jgi:hypothetical protein
MCNYIYELECTCRYFTWIKKDINGNEVSKTRLFKMITNDYVDYGRRMIVLSGKVGREVRLIYIQGKGQFFYYDHEGKLKRIY